MTPVIPRAATGNVWEVAAARCAARGTGPRSAAGRFPGAAPDGEGYWLTAERALPLRVITVELCM